MPGSQKPGQLTSLAAAGVFFLLTYQYTPALAQTPPDFDDRSNCTSPFNYVDADNDLIPDSVETTADTDNDGTPNYLDLDSDNDGLPDKLEYGGSLWATHDDDGDGVPNVFDEVASDPARRCLSSYNLWPALDMNENGVSDYLEAVPDLYTEANDPCAAHGGFTDTDRDTIADIIEGDDDTDNDGIPNYLDDDSDGDGLPDLHERLFKLEHVYDWDSDGIAEDIDVDDDDHSVNCIVELRAPADLNDNGEPDYLEPASFVAKDTDPCVAHGGYTDTDGDLIVDHYETEADTDGDGIPNYLDTDSDNDGLSDKGEYQYSTDPGSYFETNTFQFGADNDNDGYWRSLDADDDDHTNTCVTHTPEPADFNADGLPDFLDPDGDDDGLLDSEELSYNGIFTADTDNDGLSDLEEQELGLNPASPDTDGGGAFDQWEISLGANPGDASDDQSLPVDMDVDNDGISNVLEGGTSLNHDSDGDGLSDATEAGLIDADNDGRVDDQTDSNQNGQPDAGESLTALPDFDGDTIPDMRDTDSDQDGIADKLEHNNYDLPAGFAADPNDIDGDGFRNSLDLDSDNDGVFDYAEVDQRWGLVWGDFEERSEQFFDNDADGKVDEMIDRDGDLIPDVVDASYVTNAPDTDQDGIVDDADFDHAIRFHQGWVDYGQIPPKVIQHQRPTGDSDNDGIENERDPDSNNDGGFDPLMGTDPVFTDADADGIPAIFDTDDTLAYGQTAAQPNPPVQPEITAPENTPDPTGDNNQQPTGNPAPTNTDNPAQTGDTPNVGAATASSGGGGVALFLALLLLGVGCIPRRDLKQQI